MKIMNDLLQTEAITCLPQNWHLFAVSKDEWNTHEECIVCAVVWQIVPFWLKWRTVKKIMPIVLATAYLHEFEGIHRSDRQLVS